jgi:hypothetical protein
VAWQRRLPKSLRLSLLDVLAEGGMAMTDVLPTDLVARLRAVNPTRHIKVLVIEAADEIERLETERDHWHSVAGTRNVNIALIAEERDRLRAAIEEHMRTVCNDPKAAGRGADEKLWALVTDDVPEKHVCSFSYSGGVEQPNCVLCGAPRQGTRPETTTKGE